VTAFGRITLDLAKQKFIENGYIILT